MTALTGGQSALTNLSAWGRHAPLVGLAIAMVALWVTAGIGLAVNGRGVGFDSPVGSSAIAAPEQVRLKQAAASMSATRLREIAPTDAVAINASIPVSNAANPAARPFILRTGAADRERSIDCLTAAIYYEAAREPTEGQRAVAQVVLNRVRHPAYPNSVCGVVFEGAQRYTGCQFSFSCDGSLRRAPMASLWQRARAVAVAALDGFVYAPVGWATHYHANYVVPYWASSLVKADVVGTHIFYRWRGGWGRAPAFVSRYAGAEPAIAWRGGFGQPTAAERLAASGGRDAAAAAAAQAAAIASSASIDSFHRAVLRRYEPLQRESARAVIAEQVGADSEVTNSQRWALTGTDVEADAPQQRPLGRWESRPPEPVDTPPPPPPATAAASPPAAGAPLLAPAPATPTR